MEDGRELPMYKLDTSSESHPFYTGTQKSVDNMGGRVERFRNRFGKTPSPSNPARISRKGQPGPPCCPFALRHAVTTARPVRHRPVAPKPNSREPADPRHRRPRAPCAGCPAWRCCCCAWPTSCPASSAASPWKNADIAAFGYMHGTGSGHTPAGSAPQLLAACRRSRRSAALLARRLGHAGAHQPGCAPDFVLRIPFAPDAGVDAVRPPGMGSTTWLAARRPTGRIRFWRRSHARRLRARHGRRGSAGPDRQPGPGAVVARDHAALAQLCFRRFVFYGLAARPSTPLAAVAGDWRSDWPAWSLSGAPAVAVLFGAGGTVADRTVGRTTGRPGHAAADADPGRAMWASAPAPHLAWRSICGNGASRRRHRRRPGAGSRPGVCCCGSPGRPGRWRCGPSGAGADNLQPGRSGHHILLPLWFVRRGDRHGRLTQPSDRALLLALPALATLAAFALPTLKRSMLGADRLVHPAVLHPGH